MPSLAEDLVLSALQEGKLSLQGEFLWGSNYTYLTTVEFTHHTIQAVYKPTRGARPLWDFPPASLARREAAAYHLSRAAGWQLVPPTAYRRDGPYGPGSLQQFIEHDPEYHYFNFSAEDLQRLRPVALFDALTNNADRKGSHILFDSQKHLWLIDHGLCFHVEDKLRTVIWDFAGEPISPQLMEGLRTLRCLLGPPDATRTNETPPELAQLLRNYLTGREIAMLARRADWLLEMGCFPNPDPGRRQIPWPPV
jgi:hypothetical protein